MRNLLFVSSRCSCKIKCVQYQSTLSTTLSNRNTWLHLFLGLERTYRQIFHQILWLAKLELTISKPCINLKTIYNFLFFLNTDLTDSGTYDSLEERRWFFIVNFEYKLRIQCLNKKFWPQGQNCEFEIGILSCNSKF